VRNVCCFWIVVIAVSYLLLSALTGSGGSFSFSILDEETTAGGAGGEEQTDQANGRWGEFENFQF
jgi:hypothetical protein